MAQYSPALLDEIRAGVDLVELVGRFVTLRKAGANWKGLCPFHSEKTPSFMVNPAKGIFHCFGCGVGGDAFAFLMRQDRLTFPEAVRGLARSAGVPLPEERGSAAEGSGREELFRAMDLAARFYAEHLWKASGSRARQYLEQRGLDPEVARRFTLGYAPAGWEALLDFMKAEHVPEETLLAVGLVVQREARPGVYDRFRDRLLFAIRDLQGRVVAFGGRAFGDEQPKYLNSPETPLYTKGNLLYAADLARPSIRDRNRALLVEGYIDCLMAHQHGFTETVAALGTAFTPAQLALLRRYCDEAVMFFDADAAGRKAAERAAELLEPAGLGTTWAVNRSGEFEVARGLSLKVALMPAGHDPDTYLREAGAEAFAERIAAARSLLSYALERAIADPDGGTGPRARASAFARVALMLAKVADAQEAAQLSREAASRLGVDPAQLWIEAQKLSSALRRAPAAAAPAVGTGPAWQRELMSLLLHRVTARPALLALLEEGDLDSPPLRTIVAALKRRPDAEAPSLMAELPDDAARSTLAALLVEERERDDAAASALQFQQRLERARRLGRLREASRAIAAGGTDADLHDELRTLEREGKGVYEITRGAATSHHQGPDGPQGVQRHD